MLTLWDRDHETISKRNRHTIDCLYAWSHEYRYTCTSHTSLAVVRSDYIENASA